MSQGERAINPVGRGADALGWVAGGIVVGGMIGYAFRPSVLLIGKLPFTIVITRGANLVGPDRVLADTAAASFNVMIGGAVLGALSGWCFAALLERHALLANEKQPTPADTTASVARNGLSPCRECGIPVSAQAVACPGCGITSPTRTVSTHRRGV